MILYINDKEEVFKSAELTLGELLAARDVPASGTATALNGRLVTRDKWDVTLLKDGDRIMIISAAYGG